MSICPVPDENNINYDLPDVFYNIRGKDGKQGDNGPPGPTGSTGPTGPPCECYKNSLTNIIQYNPNFLATPIYFYFSFETSHGITSSTNLSLIEKNENKMIFHHRVFIEFTLRIIGDFNEDITVFSLDNVIYPVAFSKGPIATCTWAGIVNDGTIIKILKEKYQKLITLNCHGYWFIKII